MTCEEKEKIKRECKNFILQHYYFCSTCFMLKERDCQRILNYLCSGKGVIPYEIINSFDSLNIAQSIWKCDENTSPLWSQKNKKQKEIPCLQTFELILKNLSDEDKTGHLFIVDKRSVIQLLAVL